jgi:hypothetical protein
MPDKAKPTVPPEAPKRPLTRSERREAQSAEAATKQAQLKREAAERRPHESPPSD